MQQVQTFFRSVLFLSLSFFGVSNLSGCTYGYTLDISKSALRKAELTDKHETSVLRNLRLAATNRLLITLDDALLSPAQMTDLRKVLVDNFSSIFAQSQMAEGSLNKRQAIAAAKRQNANIVVMVKTIALADRISSLPEINDGIESYSDIGFDRLRLSVVVWDANANTLVNSAVLTSRTPAFQFGRHHVESLFEKSISRYVATLAAPSVYSP